MKSCVSQRTMILALVVIGAAAYTVQAGTYTYTNIVDTSGEFDGFHPPSLNDGGVVAFFANRNDYASAGVFKSDGTTTTVIVDDTGDFSFFGGGMSLASYPAMCSNGQVAFFAYRDYWEQGVYIGSGGAVTTVAESGTGDFTCTTSNPAVSDNGLVAFFACLMDVGGAIVTGDGGTPNVLTDESGPVSLLGDMVGINNSGVVAFRGVLATGPEGVFTTTGGSVDTIVDSDGDFGWFDGGVGVNDSGAVAFWAQLDNGEDGVYVSDGGSTTVIADTTSGYSGFDVSSVGINDNGTVAFLGTDDSWVNGVFTGPDPVADAVVVEGDPLFGSTVVGVEFMRFGLNDNDQVAFLYCLDDGRVGIAVATPAAGPLGDLDGDGDVDLSDLAQMLANYGLTGGATYEQGDLDSDGDVDLSDLAALLANYGA